MRFELNAPTMRMAQNSTFMMQIRPDNPIIVQGDGKVLVETTHAQYEEARDFLGRFAELEASPELLHTYRITPISLWNAACSGITKDDIIEKLRGMSKFDIPPDVLQNVSDTIERYGLVKLKPHPANDNKLIRLEFHNAYIAKLISNEPTVKEFLEEDGRRNWAIQAGHRGIFKQRMLSANWPVEDLVGFLPGEPLKVNLRDKMVGNGKDFGVRPYQATAAARWHLMGLPAGGHGVVVLPCGAGKNHCGHGDDASLPNAHPHTRNKRGSGKPVGARADRQNPPDFRSGWRLHGLPQGD